MENAIELLTIHDCEFHAVAATQIIHPDYVQNPDWMPVTTARASHGNQNKTGEDEEKDLKLMRFLAEHQHTTPFEHLSVTIFAEMPIFVTREWHRHRTQSYSEISMRYTSKPARRFWIPDKWRSNDKPDGNKQGSGAPIQCQGDAMESYKGALDVAYSTYKLLSDKEQTGGFNIALEQARAILPVATITSMFATANLLNWFRFWKLRIAPNAMYEIRLYGAKLQNELEKIYPKAWGTLINATEHI